MRCNYLKVNYVLLNKIVLASDDHRPAHGIQIRVVKFVVTSLYVKWSHQTNVPATPQHYTNSLATGTKNLSTKTSTTDNQ